MSENDDSYTRKELEAYYKKEMSEETWRTFRLIPLPSAARALGISEYLLGRAMQRLDIKQHPATPPHRKALSFEQFLLIVIDIKTREMNSQDY